MISTVATDPWVLKHTCWTHETCACLCARKAREFWIVATPKKMPPRSNRDRLRDWKLKQALKASVSRINRGRLVAQ